MEGDKVLWGNWSEAVQVKTLESGRDILDTSQINLSWGYLTRSHTNQAVQP